MTPFTDEHPTLKTTAQQIETTVTHIVVMLMGAAAIAVALYVAVLHEKAGAGWTGKDIGLQLLYFTGGGILMVPKRVQAFVMIVKDKIPWGKK